MPTPVPTTPSPGSRPETRTAGRCWSPLRGGPWRLACCACAIALCSIAHSRADHWPEYRGPTCDGHAPNTSIPLTWSESTHVRWKTRIHDKGWSTPVIWNQQIWLTTAREDGRKMYVLCIDRDSGTILWDKKLFDVPHPRPLGNDMNGYASPSPVIEAGRVYVHFGSYGTACLNTETCDVLWQRRDLPCNHFRGPGSSPVLCDGLLIFHMDGSDHQYIVALDKQTGRMVWKTDRSTDYGDLGLDGKPAGDGDFRKAFNTPLVVRVRGRRLLISPAAKAFYAYDPLSGKEIWQVRHQGHSTACRPLFDGQNVYLNTGSGHTEMVGVDPTGRGDVTDTHIAWRLGRFVPKRSSPVLVDGRIYAATTGGVACCVDPQSGQVVWRRRIGSSFTSSVLYAARRIYFFDEDGLTVVVRPGPEYRELARNRLDAGFMASPVAIGPALYLRTVTHLYRIES